MYIRNYLKFEKDAIKQILNTIFCSIGIPEEVVNICCSYHRSRHIFTLTRISSDSLEPLSKREPLPPTKGDPPPGYCGNYAPFTVYSIWGDSFLIGHTGNAAWDTQKTIQFIENIFNPVNQERDRLIGKQFNLTDPYNGNHSSEDAIQKALVEMHPIEVIIVNKGIQLLPQELIVSGGHRRRKVKGRPFVTSDSNKFVTATLCITEQEKSLSIENNIIQSNWSIFLPNAAGVMLPSLSAIDCQYLFRAWANDGLAEHASIGSFAKHTLSLLAVGAPSVLISHAQRAGQDEVIHARLCFSLARGYARGSVVEPSLFPLGASVAIDRTLPILAKSTADEGCVEETVSCLLAFVSLAHACIPVVINSLKRIVYDEARHAALAWCTVNWALRACGERGESYDLTIKEIRKGFARGCERKTTRDSLNDAVDDIISREPGIGRINSDTSDNIRKWALTHLVLPWSTFLIDSDSTNIIEMPLVIPPAIPGLVDGINAVRSAIHDISNELSSNNFETELRSSSIITPTYHRPRTQRHQSIVSTEH